MPARDGAKSPELASSPATAGRLPAWIAAAACLLLTLVYVPGLQSFFSNDDWALVYYYGQVQPARFWEYFSPVCIWFYRPLQAAQFGLFYHWFGLNELPYNLSLMAMHLVVCWLSFLLLRDLTRRPRLAAAAVSLFAALWMYVDILIWKANFNSAQWAILTLATCVAFTRYLRTGQKRWQYFTFAFCFANLFTKEAAVNTPILLLLIWACLEWNVDSLRPASWPGLLRRGAFLLGPAVLVVAVYIGLHGVLVKDVYSSVMKPDYSFVSPGQAIRQILVAYNHTLISFRADPVLLPAIPGLRKAVLMLLQDRFPIPLNLLLVPLAVAAVAWRTRDRVILFGLGWILISFLPMIFLKSFHASRFYYLPALGGALVVAQLLCQAWAAAERLAQRPRSAARVAVTATVIYLVVANVASTLNLVLADRDQSTKSRGVYELLRTRRGQLEPGALVVLRNAPETFFNGGLGAPEMARLALNDRTVDAVIDGQHMEDARVAELKAKPHVYLVDLNRSPLQLERVIAAADH
jgi:hypothetical protein